METIKEEQFALDETNPNPIELEAPAQNKPAIDHLPDAIVRNEMGMLVLLVKPGEKLVIERCASILASRPWLDTKTYVVQTIDEATGHVSLWDEDLHRFAGTNYVSGLKAGYRFKMATSKASAEIGKKKRGRPRKNPPVEARPVQVGADGKPEKKKRGRPAGVKNRPKDVIAAEKAAIRKARAEKAAKRTSKKAVKVARSTAPVEPVVPSETAAKEKAKPKAKTKTKVKAKPVAKKAPAKKPAAKKVAAKKPAKGAKAKPKATVGAKGKTKR